MASPLWLRDPLGQASVLDDAERRHPLDPEPLGEIGALVHRDANELEAVVVAPMLQHLR